MKRITLVGTVHRQAGRCNEQELENILFEINPEVIFEEIRPADFKSFYGDDSKYTMEMRAIKKYLWSRKVHQEPVDSYEIPEGFAPRVHALDKFVESRCGEYRSLMDEIDDKMFSLGYAYLNGQEFYAHIRKSERLYFDTVHAYGNDLARTTLSEWNDQLRMRDDSMLGSICQFCQKTNFTEAAFLIGAGHLPSIVEVIESRMKDLCDSVLWSFWNGR